MAQQGNNYAGNRRNNVRNIVKAEDRKIVDFPGIPGLQADVHQDHGVPRREVVLPRRAGHAGQWRAAGDRFSHYSGVRLTTASRLRPG